MPHAFALSLTRPHERLNLPMPFARRLPRGITAWNVILVSLTILIGLVYVVLVNNASSQSYVLRKMEKRVEHLKNETTMLEDSLVTHSSLTSLNARARGLGFVPVHHLEFIHPASYSFALK